MNLVLALVLILVLAWLLGIGHFVQFNASIHLAGGLQTLIVIVLVVALLVMLAGRGRYRI
jgi:hypothetical protein